MAARLSHASAHHAHRPRPHAEQADTIFTGCRLAGHNGNSEGVRNEESQYHPDIFVCGPPREPWPQLWKDHQDFG